MKRGDRLDALLAGSAFLAAAVRTWPLVAPTDAAFRLVRVGDGLALDGLATYAVPPGGEGATPIGAIVGAVSALFAPGSEGLGRASGAVCAGIAAALLAWFLATRADRLTALLGVVLLAMPPAFASAFVARPDAAAGGVLLLAALIFRWIDGGPGRSLAFAWTATLATPVAWPAAVALQIGSRSRRGLHLLPAACAATVLAGASLALPAGSRGEILRGIFTDWTLNGAGWPSTGAALARVWAFGALLAAPLLLLRFGDLRERALVAPWAAAVAAAALLDRDGMFRETLAAWIPATCLLLALLARALPDAGVAGAPRRAVLGGLAIPLAFLLLGRGEAAAWRTDLHEETARDAQVADFLRTRYGVPGAVLTERCGVLAATSDRETRSLRAWREGDKRERPEVVVFRRAMRPESAAERRLFGSPGFLTHYAPFLFRRGPTRGIQDAVWVRRLQPVAGGAPPPQYPELLRAGWERHANHDVAGARHSFQAGAGLEPAGLGIAHEWAGLMFETEGDPGAAEALFLQALPDPATELARAHLADRALSRNRLAQADSLIAQALAFTDQDPEVWGLRARLQGMAGDAAAALEDSGHAVWLDPREGRLLANHGILLWRTGQQAEARRFWRLAVQRDSRLLQYLGDFEKAPDDAPAPPLLPLFSLKDFKPDLAKRPGGPPAGADTTGAAGN